MFNQSGADIVLENERAGIYVHTLLLLIIIVIVIDV